jgi:TatD DNase family protein
MQPKNSLFDTHCHIHSVDYALPITEVDAHNVEAGVDYLVCVGCDAADSQRAVDFVADRPNNWASVGQHPHEAQYGMKPLKKLRELVELDRRRSAPSSTSTVLGEAENGGEKASERKIIAIGECGLDYFYGHSSKEEQEMALRYQIELALEYDLPLIFHVREAFDDFWPIFDSYQGIRGVLHSFTDNSANLSKAIARGLYIGVNGIMTFTKIPEQLEVAKQIPSDRLVLETDSPFLTPVPLRGKVNEPAHVLLVARFLSELRQISLQEVAQQTTTNARQLFSL